MTKWHESVVFYCLHTNIPIKDEIEVHVFETDSFDEIYGSFLETTKYLEHSQVETNIYLSPQGTLRTVDMQSWALANL